MEPFEARFAELVRAYTDAATEQRIDARAVARAAMSSRGASSWVAGTPSWRIAGAPWAAALAALVVVGVVAIAVLQRPLDPATVPSTTATTRATLGPIPAVILHSWQRPYAVTAGLDQWGSGFLSVTDGLLELRAEPSGPASRSTVAAEGPDRIVVTATGETTGCAIADVGAYRWMVEGKGTVLTLAPVAADGCSARELALAGEWVRADLAGSTAVGPTLEPGEHRTSEFDPFGDPLVTGQLSYTVPEGWTVKEDRSAWFLLHQIADGSGDVPPSEAFVFVFAQPGVAADFEDGAACGEFSDAPEVGGGVDDIEAAIITRAGVIATPAAEVIVGGYEGRMLDLRLAPSWTGGCLAPDLVLGTPILNHAGPGPGPAVGLGPDGPIRLILLDLGNDRTIAIAVSCFGPSRPDVLEAAIAGAMPVIESFEFHPPAP
jgi:hypothetical protein